MKTFNIKAKAIFDVALANQWYAVVSAVFRSSLKDILVEKYVRTMIQESPQDFSAECVDKSDATQWAAVGYRVATMRTLSYMIVVLAKHRDEVRKAQDGDDDDRQTARKCEDLLAHLRSHCRRQIGRIKNPQHKSLVREIVDKIYHDAEGEIASR